jgi:hypothetical protein
VITVTWIEIDAWIIKNMVLEEGTERGVGEGKNRCEVFGL